MTTPTDSTETSEDFECTKTLGAPPEKVLAALRTPEAVADWWGPPRVGRRGGTLEVSFDGAGDPAARGAGRAGQVVWNVKATPLTPEWVGTRLVFEVAASGDGSDLHFRHPG